MLMNLSIGLPTMMLCLVLQSSLLVYVLRYYARREHLVRSPTIGTSMIVINSVMLMLIVGNVAQVMIWAMLFMVLGEFSEFSTAVYHSAVNFSTLGYGDIVMSDEYRLLGPLESINGVIMIGVTTSALMAVIQDAWKKHSSQGR